MHGHVTHEVAINNYIDSYLLISMMCLKAFLLCRQTVTQLLHSRGGLFKLLLYSVKLLLCLTELLLCPGVCLLYSFELLLCLAELLLCLAELSACPDVCLLHSFQLALGPFEPCNLLL